MNDYQWQYATAEDLDKSFLDRLRAFPRKPDISVYFFRSIFMLLLRFWLKIYHRLHVAGIENLPPNGSFIVVSNHTSHLDALCLLSLFPCGKMHRVFPVAAMDYFFATVPRTFFSAVFINALPFGRYSNTKNSLTICREILANPGNILIVFPEGTRSKTGEVGQFKPGIGHLLAESRIPCIPCWIQGAYDSWPKGRLIPRPKKVQVRVGRPLVFDSFSKEPDTAKKIVDEIKASVVKLMEASG